MEAILDFLRQGTRAWLLFTLMRRYALSPSSKTYYAGAAANVSYAAAATAQAAASVAQTADSTSKAASAAASSAASSATAASAAAAAAGALAASTNSTASAANSAASSALSTAQTSATAATAGGASSVAQALSIAAIVMGSVAILGMIYMSRLLLLAIEVRVNFLMPLIRQRCDAIFVRCSAGNAACVIAAAVGCPVRSSEQLDVKAGHVRCLPFIFVSYWFSVVHALSCSLGACSNWLLCRPH
jgi:hypothetical protein